MSTEINEPVAPSADRIVLPGAAAEANIRLRQSLLRLRRGIQRHLMLECLSWEVVISVAFAFGSFVLDYMIVMTKPQRGLILALSVGAIVFIFLRLLWRPLSRRISDEDLALVVENHFPQLEDRVITTVQLGAQAQTLAHEALSAQLLDAVAEQAIDRVNQLSVTEPLNSERLGKRLVFGAAAAVLFAIPWVIPASLPYAKVWVQRVPLLQNVPYPRAMMLDVVGFKGGVMRVAKGDKLTIEVMATGARIPSRIRFDMRFVNSGRFREDVERGESSRRFAKEFANVTESFVFTVAGGDYRSDPYSVEVVDPPILSDVKFTCVYPTYTGLESKTFEVKDGGLEAVVGSTISVQASSNKKLNGGTLSWAGPTRPLVAQLEVRDTQMQGSFQVKDSEKDSGSLRFHLTDYEGFSSDAFAFPVTTMPDRPPNVKLSTKGIGDKIVPNARVPLEIETSDDYGITQLLLSYAFRDDAREAKTMEIQGAPVGRKRFTFTYPWEVESLGLKEGDIITFHSEALDFVQGKGSSARLALRVVSREELADEMNRLLKQYSAELDRLIKRQRETTLVSKLSRDRRWSGQMLGQMEEQQKYQEVIANERDLGNTLQTLSDQVARLTDERENNRLGNEEEYEHWRSEVVVPLAEVSKQVLGQIVSRVSEGQAEPQQIAAVQKMDDAIAEQEKAEVRMTEILSNMATYVEWKWILENLQRMRDEASVNHTGIKKAWERKIQDILNQKNPTP